MYLKYLNLTVFSVMTIQNGKGTAEQGGRKVWPNKRIIGANHLHNYLKQNKVP